MSNEQFKRAFVDGVLTIDCKDIRLTQNSTNSPKRWRGSGSLMIDPRKGIEARFVSMDVISPLPTPLDSLLRMGEVESGQIIPESHYYSLCAFDVSGNEWTNPSVEVETTFYNDSTVIVLKCGWIRNVMPAVGAKDSVHMLFLDEIPFPMNSLERSQTVREGRESTNISYTASCGTAGGAVFRYASFGGSQPYYELFAKPTDGVQLPSNFEYRVIEAIRFLSATAMSFSVCETVHGENRSIEISKVLPLNRGVFPSPLMTRRDWTEDFYRLLDCYLRYAMSKVSGDEFANLSLKMGGLYQLKGVSLDDVALLISVAIESIVQKQFPTLGKATEATLADLKTVFSSLDGLTFKATNTLERAKSSLGGLKSSRAVDKLYELQRAGAINAEEIAGWKKLRDSSTHGSLHVPNEEMQQLLDSVHKASVLLNKLVFISVGYSGKYIDYSTHGWPEANFDSSVYKALITDE